MDIQCIATFINDGPKKLSLPITFSIAIDQVGTDSCYLVELSDSMIFNYQMDTLKTCSQACSKAGEIVRRLTDPMGFSVTYTYPDVGRYEVSVTACNLVYTMTVSGEAACAPKPCSIPKSRWTQKLQGKVLRML